MPHQNTDAGEATAQNAATDKTMPNDQAREQNVAVDPEPRSYAAPELKDSTLAAPAAGEIADFMDEGEALGEDDVQLGSTNRNRPKDTENAIQRGAKTREGDRHIQRTGSAD